MKKVLTSIFLSVLIVSLLFMTSCNPNDFQQIINNNTQKTLETPTNLRVDESSSTLWWNSVEYASGYTILVNDTTYTATTNSFSLSNLRSGEYTISVKANGDGVMYVSSAYSNTISYVRVTSSGNEYEDEVIAAFKEFDEVNTKNSFLGYGIDIINASAITSKNVLMTYPIFDMDKLMDETLLKSNEHYNSFESIEAESIVEFCQNMSNSTSITAGQSVSAKGKVKGGTIGASTSLSGGLTTSFTKTSSSVESQYFLEVIAENQSYWLILQTSEARYKEILSEEFKKDLYDSSITPAQLFDKYGTHLLTSVAMGGNICMYYTMYSYDKDVSTTTYAEISSTLKANVEAAYGKKVSGEASSESSFENTFTYATLASQYGIQIDKKIISAGGGSFGINNETTLYENYYDWQKSLDTYPVVIGIKDTNSLYPIWNLLDLNVEGATDRYNELYNYFAEYGTSSYNAMCELYSITPSVTPTNITNITVGSHNNYSENQVVNVKSGETLQISFDVKPDNANKYIKTFSVDNESLASIDDTGLISILPDTPGGSYINVTVTAGPISKQITLYVINTYNVTFNTRVSGLNVASIYGILEGYTIDEPQISREGYILEGWYTDSANTNKYDFENDCVTSHMTLFAKWVAIKPVVTFDTAGGSLVDSQTVSYNSIVSKPKNPTFSGYTFGGWYVDEECTETFDFSTTIVSDITLYAKWDKIEYTVTFVTNGGTPVASITTSIVDGYRIDEPVTVKQYYTLDGWYKDPNFVQKFYFETEITSDLTLYTKWTPIKVSINLVDTDGSSPLYDEWGTTILSRTTDIEKAFKIDPITPYKSGYAFVGWYLDGTLIDLASYSEFRPREEGYTLIARWSINEYTLAFDTDGGNAMLPLTQKYGTEIASPNDPVKTGYTFVGWDRAIPETMPAEDIVLKAIWLVNQYTISFNTDGGSAVSSITQDYGTKITEPTAPSREGYTFISWDKAIPVVMPAENMSINAIWSINSYTVTYMIDGIEYSVDEYEFGEEIYYPEVNISGYTFSGWKYGYKDVPAVMPAQNIIISGSLAVNNYKIEYYVDEVLYSTKTYAFGESFALIQEPVVEGKVFSGWICSTLDTMPSTMPAFNLRIDGSFDQMTYYIRYYIDDILVKTSSIIKGHGIPKYEPESKEGYSFSGWVIKDGENLSLIPDVMPEKDLAAYGSYNINSYSIRFNTSGGTEIESITATYGTPITAPSEPTKLGYTFSGWNRDIPSTMPAENIVITANWSVNKYTITFVDGTGNKISSLTQDYNTSISKPSDPTRIGYTFVMWDKAIPNFMPAEDMTITAIWTVNQYKISFVDGCGNDLSVSVQDYGTQIITPAYPTRIGYTFIGWDNVVPETLPAENLIITAEWKINQYTITFETDGGTEIAPIVQDYGTGVTAPVDPSKVGYSFAGWDRLIPETMPADDVTITADWKVNQYTVTFDTGEGSKIDSITLDYGSTIEKPTDPKRPGYRFDGWDISVPETMPANDLTLTAKWTLFESHITYDLNGKITVNGEIAEGEFSLNDMGIEKLSYEVTHLNDADAADDYKYKNYFNFVGWFTESGLQITDSNGALVDNADGYVSDGRWVRETFDPITLYAHWDTCVIFNDIASTPDISDERVIIDWSNAINIDVNAVRDNSVILVNNTVKELIFFGNPGFTYKNMSISLVDFADNQKLTVRFIDFNFISNSSSAISTTKSECGINLSLEVKGVSSINTSVASGKIVDLSNSKLEILGNGTLTITAGDGSKGSKSGSAGSAGGDAIIVRALLINMDTYTGQLIVNGGKGGNGAAGYNGDGDPENGGPGGKGAAGGIAINAESVILSSGNIIISGGSGGSGGKGGKGDEGAFLDYDGDGGKGGAGGAGGCAIQTDTLDMTSKKVSGSITGGTGGNGGNGGNGGSGGANVSVGGSGGAGGSGGCAISFLEETTNDQIILSKGKDGTKGKKGSGT